MGSEEEIVGMGHLSGSLGHSGAGRDFLVILADGHAMSLDGTAQPFSARSGLHLASLGANQEEFLWSDSGDNLIAACGGTQGSCRFFEDDVVCALTLPVARLPGSIDLDAYDRKRVVVAFGGVPVLIERV
jgi:hypothetical protein